MALNTEMLFLGPFKEVIERGKEAVVNAEYGIACGKQDSAPLLNAAQAVAREGERALNKLQPLWNSQMEKYGSAFEDKLSQNGAYWFALKCHSDGELPVTDDR